VRLAVFVDEQGVPEPAELDTFDRRAFHVVAVLEAGELPGDRAAPPGAARGATAGHAPSGAHVERSVAWPSPVVGTARLLPEEGGAARIGRVAVLAAWRGRGIGSRLITLLEATARTCGARRLTLHAQVPVEGFYARHGYHVEPPGDVFFEDGIPHRLMSKALG
jgi:predicted GNAT family N-acyltransferase